jgi:ribonuclease G
MSGNLLVINVDIREVRVALIESGVIAELHIERLSRRSTLGNIYLGKVSRVLPGMQAAFIDIGQERAAFLHVEDLIRPDDFEQYLAKARDASARDESDGNADDAGEADAPAEGSVDADAQRTEAREEEGREEGRRGRRRRRRRGRGERRGPSADARDRTSDASADRDDAPRDGDGDDAELVLEEERDRRLDEERDHQLEAEAGEGYEANGSDLDSDADDGGDLPDEPAAAAEGRDSQPAVGSDDEDDGTADDRDDGSDDDRQGGDDRAELAAEDDEVGATERDDDDEVSATDRDDDDATAADGETDEEPSEGLASATDDGGEPNGEQLAEIHDDDTMVSAADEVASEVAVARAALGEQTARTGREPIPVHRARVARSGRTRRTASTAGAPGAAKPGQPTPARADARRDGNKRGRDGRRTKGALDKTRISKSTPIREVVREGQHVIVQVTKEPIGTKGARVSSHVSLAGRYAVYLPTVDHVGVSKRIGNDKERARLREVIESVKPPTGGLVVRTVAEGLTKKKLKNDIGYLVRLWDEIIKQKGEVKTAPAELYEELDLVLKTARDLFTEDVAKIIIDNREQYGRLRRFVEMFMPERAGDVELYEGREPVFDAYGIEDEIGRALSRKVPLDSGGYLIIDQAEALTAIDVNSGRYVGKGSKDLEETILATNLEAVHEIAYQLRFRNIGGLIILDLIDMERAKNREKVRQRLEELLARDKAKTTLNRISDLGLIEMTRKRTRESLGRLLHEPCFYCDGTGQLMSKETIAYEILRQIRREQSHLKGYKITVNAHPAIVDLLKTEEQDAVKEAERMFMRRIDLVPRKEYHIEQFDLQGA